MNREQDFKHTFFRRELRRVAVSKLAVCIAVLVIIVLVNTVDTVSLAAARIKGTAEIDPAVLLTVTDPEHQLTAYPFSANLESSHIYNEYPELRKLFYTVDGKIVLSFTPEAIEETGYTAKEKSGAESDTVEYVYARIGEKLLLVKRPVLMPIDRLTGTIGYLPEDVKTIIAADMVDPDTVLPLFMDATLDVYHGFTTEILFSALLLIAWGVCFFFRIRELTHYDRTEAYRQLFICPGTVEENAFAIDEELKAVSPGALSLFWTIETEHWTLRRRPFGFTLERHPD